MSSTKLRDNALDLIGKAIKKDHKKATTKEKTEALHLYIQGLEALKKAIKYEKLPAIINQLKAYSDTQEERCKQLLEEIKKEASSDKSTYHQVFRISPESLALIYMSDENKKYLIN